MAERVDGRRTYAFRVERSGGADRAQSRPVGLCECGCGQATSLARQTSRAKGWVKGESLRFIRGHANRTKQRSPIDSDDYKVEGRGYTTHCWIWRGKLNNKGYGKVRIAGQIRYAHRAMFEQDVGPIPDGLELDHLCRQTDCVRPSHLEPVAHAVNIRRGKNAKITDEQAAAIRADTRLCREIGADYGLDASYVWRIRAGQKRNLDA